MFTVRTKPQIVDKRDQTQTRRRRLPNNRRTTVQEPNNTEAKAENDSQENNNPTGDQTAEQTTGLATSGANPLLP
ncbi:hypothetical protein HJC23_000266 [Cyclotella cryptica]|uniref:Uncharacterized protein n=1 Tax=Cyclotella cryptica TaxID=29204 RepID=A0ABD3QE05_9STRA